jgi:hypothetical protein
MSKTETSKKIAEIIRKSLSPYQGTIGIVVVTLHEEQDNVIKQVFSIVSKDREGHINEEILLHTEDLYNDI